MHKRDCTQEVVGIWGAGPIGLHLVQWCLKVFKVKKVYLMDPVQNRLDWAKKIWPEVEIVNPNDVKSVPEYLHENSEKQIVSRHIFAIRTCEVLAHSSWCSIGN